MAMTEEQIARLVRTEIEVALREAESRKTTDDSELRAQILSLQAEVEAVRDEMPDDYPPMAWPVRDIPVLGGGGAVDSEKTAGDDLQSRSIEKDATTREMRLFEMLVPTGTDTTLETNELVGIRQAEDSDGVPRLRWIIPKEVLRWLVADRTQVKYKESPTATEYSASASLYPGAVWTIDNFAWDADDEKLTIYVGQECQQV